MHAILLQMRHLHKFPWQHAVGNSGFELLIDTKLHLANTQLCSNASRSTDKVEMGEVTETTKILREYSKRTIAIETKVTEAKEETILSCAYMGIVDLCSAQFPLLQIHYDVFARMDGISKASKAKQLCKEETS